MLWVHLRGRVCPGHSNGLGSKRMRLVLKRIVIFVQSQECVQLAKFNGLLADMKHLARRRETFVRYGHIQFGECLGEGP